MSGLGIYDDRGAHRCPCGAKSRYAMFSGGREWQCETCGADGSYPEGAGGPRARLLDQPGGFEQLRDAMTVEIERRRAPGGARAEVRAATGESPQPPEALLAAKFGPRAYTREQAEFINEQVESRKPLPGRALPIEEDDR